MAKHEQTPAETKRLDDLKETLALLSGLEAKSPRSSINIWQSSIRFSTGNGRSIAQLFKDAVGPVTAEQLYVNQKVSDLISNAEMEQNDYRRGGKPNVFFGAEKRYLRGEI